LRQRARTVGARRGFRLNRHITWLARLTGRRHPNVAAVALANKNARIVWALLNHERNYQCDYQPSGALYLSRARSDEAPGGLLLDVQRNTAAPKYTTAIEVPTTVVNNKYGCS
jgi:hypothetical protein